MAKHRPLTCKEVETILKNLGFAPRCEDVPGLVTEADIMENLVDKLKVLIPELLEANEAGNGEEVSFRLLSELTAIARRQAA